MPELELKVFLSSPGDVPDERGLARTVIARLEKEHLLRGRVQLEEISWDDPTAALPLSAHLTPQEAINRRLPKPSECDVVVVILWSRMGTPLPDEYRKPDSGERYLSGTEWEFLDAVAAARKSDGKPFVLLYRRTEEPVIKGFDPVRDEKIAQLDAVKCFFDALQAPDRALLGSYKTYATPSEFRELIESDLRALIAERLATLAAGKPPKDLGSTIQHAERLEQQSAGSTRSHDPIERIENKGADVFLSYAREDQERVKVLEAEG